jgi:hypothetical protein
MVPSARHEQVEVRLRQLLAAANLPDPDDVAHVSRAVIFLWYETKAFVLVDLDEVPDGDDPLDGLDVTQLAIDLDDELAA